MIRETPSRRRALLAGALGLAAGAALRPTTTYAARAKARPVPASPAAAATVVAFTGYVPANDTIRGSATDKIVSELQARGLAAEVHPPNDWSAVGEELAGARRPAGPLILVGYSLGAGSSTQLAARLAQAGIPVRAIVIVEAWNPSPIPANVERAVHYYASKWATALRAGEGYSGSIENVDLRSLVPGIEDAGHVSMSHLQAVQDIVIAEVMNSAGLGPAAASRPTGAGRIRR